MLSKYIFLSMSETENILPSFADREAMGFLGETILSANLMEKHFLYSTHHYTSTQKLFSVSLNCTQVTVNAIEL